MGKTVTGLILAAVLIVVVYTALPREESPDTIKIGTPDDSGSLIVNYILKEIGYQQAKVQPGFATYSITDCCSSTTQRALSAGLFDFAIMCPDAAHNLIKKDDRFEIVSPLMVNSEIMVVKKGATPKKIGIAQNRTNQEQMVKEKFGPETIAVPLLLPAIQYVFEKNEVDGVVVDAFKGLSLNGDILAPESDLVTSFLVARKSLRGDPRFQEIIDLFSQSAEELNHPDILQKAVKEYVGIQFGPEEVEMWNRLRIRFVFIMPGTAG